VKTQDFPPSAGDDVSSMSHSCQTSNINPACHGGGDQCGAAFLKKFDGSFRFGSPPVLISAELGLASYRDSP